MDSFVFITNYFRLKLLLQLLKEQKNAGRVVYLPAKIKLVEKNYIFSFPILIKI